MNRPTVMIIIGAVIGTILGTIMTLGICIILAAAKIIQKTQEPAVIAIGILNWNLLILGALIGCCVGLLLGRRISKWYKRD